MPISRVANPHAHAPKLQPHVRHDENWQQRPLSRADAQLVRSVNINLNINIQSQPGRQADCFHPPRCGNDGPNQGPRSCWPHPPLPSDSCHPHGCLQTDPNGVVTTPGGYKIQSDGATSWKITGPDGKTTSVSGDPHVAEGDGGKWDFKRDSTFVLGDGTRINVSTTPAGNGMTVTKGLDIISGNDLVQISDIDKGKGKTGSVTHDGFQHVNDFGGKDVIVQGRETDDWSFQGREIVGSEGGGDSFKLGNALPAGAQWPGGGGSPFGGVGHGPAGIAPGEPYPGMQSGSFGEHMQALFGQLAQLCEQLTDMTGSLSEQCGGFSCPPGQGNWMNRRQEQLGQSFGDIGRMADLFARNDALTRSVQPYRFGFQA